MTKNVEVFPLTRTAITAAVLLLTACTKRDEAKVDSAQPLDSAPPAVTDTVIKMPNAVNMDTVLKMPPKAKKR